MSILDEWVSGFNAALTTVGTALGTGIGAYFLGRRQFSKLAKDIAEDRAEVKRAGMEIGWLERMVKEHEEDKQRIESLRESQLNDARLIATKDADARACRERMEEAKLERDLAIEEVVKVREMLSAAKEHIIVVDGLLLTARVANVRLFAALPDGQRQEMAELLLKQEPGQPGQGV